MIRIDAIWLATETIDVRAGIDTILARVVKVFGAARPHHAYLFANKHSTRIKVLVYDGFGIWLAARRLNRKRPAMAPRGVPAGDQAVIGAQR
ncbi:IS66 family insertion sequence element accessory protein TnpB [Paraburkholderia phymatum]|uniref:IS66 family insertion sequence element accessory protein TnpB n=1 Tax=Paraburkholderia phymatum TaxID=148447 RepID=A0ACC6U8G7_9BURK